ncbi:MAG TPA: metal-dependent hydrolase [Verrucomicrobiae bacterium]|nr:metal-dependent hydrolase [Verrucomicrobiae bacterium]
MEPVTHFLFGACLGRAGLNRKTGLATLTLVLAAEAPDLDVLWYFGGSVTGFQHHRGITHTFLGAPFVAALTLAGVYGIYRLMKARGSPPKSPPNWKWLYICALLGCLSHIFLDFMNNYGVRPFAPFNSRWYSWDIVFIVDPLILGLLAFGLVLPGFLSLITEEIGARKTRFRGRGAAIFVLLCVAAVIATRDFEHRRALNALESLTYRDEQALRVSAYPAMLDPFFWYGVVETRDFLEALPVNSGNSEVDPDNTAVYRYKPEETPVTLAAKKSRLGQVYLDWAQYPLIETSVLPDNKGSKVQFQDWRFYQIPIRSERNSPPLAGYVVLGPNLQVQDMYIGERNAQKPAR